MGNNGSVVPGSTDGASPSPVRKKESALSQSLKPYVDSFLQYGKQVNIVVTGSMCTGTLKICDKLSKSSGFLYVDRDCSNKEISDSCTELERLHKQVFDSGGKNKEFMMHLISSLEHDARHVSETTKKAKKMFRVFHKSVLDDVECNATVSFHRNFIDETDYSLLSAMGKIMWEKFASDCDPSTTLFVYLKYPSDKYTEIARDGISKNLSRREETDSKPSSHISTRSASKYTQSRLVGEKDTIRRNGIRLTRIAEEPDAHDMLTTAQLLYKTMEDMYSSGDVTKSYFSVVIQCEDSPLSESPYAEAVCHCIMESVFRLQEEKIWGKSCEEVKKFIVAPRFQIARNIVINNSAAKALGQRGASLRDLVLAEQTQQDDDQKPADAPITQNTQAIEGAEDIRPVTYPQDSPIGTAVVRRNSSVPQRTDNSADNTVDYAEDVEIAEEEEGRKQEIDVQ